MKNLSFKELNDLNGGIVEGGCVIICPFPKPPIGFPRPIPMPLPIEPILF
ncbi:hypothetical protein [Aureibacter tunicatorum]|uniref:Uncharacterized protein n=1 Tax=Aureibacter tunicatorum TaxID=866807 RepID=A0AAE3XS06_9BACT|nr:hypothetical protein [Aureibacter tunicatorum]MDR6242087.1 hypothetical protein [Aureibacter tunicatorum]BDD07560.1 hypothetical protein AUTU_50430 [Aureibacter tunicatorum]